MHFKSHRRYTGRPPDSDTLHLVHSSPTQRVVSSKVISHPNFTDFTFKFSDSLHSVLTLEKEVEWARVEDRTGQV